MRGSVAALEAEGPGGKLRNPGGQTGGAGARPGTQRAACSLSGRNWVVARGGSQKAGFKSFLIEVLRNASQERTGTLKLALDLQ